VAPREPDGQLAVEKSSGRFLTDEKLRFSRELRFRDRIPAIGQAIFSAACQDLPGGVIDVSRPFGSVQIVNSAIDFRD
jgi:hypothetical protein